MTELFTKAQENEMENANAFFAMGEFPRALDCFLKINLRAPNAEGEVEEPPCGFSIGAAIIAMRIGKCRLKMIDFEPALSDYNSAEAGLTLSKMPHRISSLYGGLVSKLRQIIHHNRAYCYYKLAENARYHEHANESEALPDYGNLAITEIEKAIELGKINSFCVQSPIKDYMLSQMILSETNNHIAARAHRLEAESIERRLITVGMAYGSF